MADSSRKVVMDTLRGFCEEVRGGIHFVKRGPINWATFNFEKHARAIAILMDDQSMLADVNEASISLEIAGKMIATADEPALDDGLMDEMIDDVEWTIRSLIGSTYPNGDNVILRAALKDARIIEFHDSQMQIQGIVAFFEVSF